MKRPKTPPGRPPSGTVSRYEVERRLAIQKERKIRLQNDRTEGGLLDAEAVEQHWAEMVLAARAAFLAIPSRLKGRRPALGAEDIREVDNLIRAVLEELADGVPPEAAG
jgi:phage terminase Nu1 subunit (DNA packaging protein)